MGHPGTCSHASCGCAPADVDTCYCGSYCANAAETEALPGEADLLGACACGHDACANELPEPVGRETVVSTGRS